MYYGFPSLPVSKFGMPEGLKVAHHYPGTVVDPDNVNRNTTADEEENLRYVLNKYLPGCFDSFLTSKICLYTNTSDEDFIIDRSPGYEDLISVACGFSGHGFKFVSVVGEILADLATDGETKLSIGFLNAKRLM
jgi:glycine/D-amino acid oxidase-like deaminating enzyme